LVYLESEDHIFEIPIFNDISKFSKCFDNISRYTSLRLGSRRWEVSEIDTSIAYTFEIYWVEILCLFCSDKSTCNFSYSPCTCSLESCVTMTHPDIDTIMRLSTYPGINDSSSSILYTSQSKPLKKNMRPKVIRLWSRNHTCEYRGATCTIGSISVEFFVCGE
jgi:hypothetical protein